MAEQVVRRRPIAVQGGDGEGGGEAGQDEERGLDAPGFAPGPAAQDDENGEGQREGGVDEGGRAHLRGGEGGAARQQARYVADRQQMQGMHSLSMRGV